MGSDKEGNEFGGSYGEDGKAKEMSVWTHVAGTIRYDAFRIPGAPDQNPSSWIGETDLYHENNPDSTMPRGSEGSLNYKCTENPNTSSLAAYTVAIWGDLRDYYNVDEIREWLESITEGRLVRQGVITCHVEGQRSVLFEHTEDGWVSTDGAVES